MLSRRATSIVSIFLQSFVVPRARSVVFFTSSSMSNNIVSSAHPPSVRVRSSSDSSSTKSVPEGKRMRHSLAMQNSHTLCSTCDGEGSVLHKQRHTKKSKLAYKRAKAQAEKEGKVFTPPPPAPLRYQCCTACHGTGLVRNSGENHSIIAATATSTGMDHDRNRFHVAIIGGGIGGIALALALQHRDISYTVYERDASFNERRQGYGLTMQQGARALKSLGFDDHYYDSITSYNNDDSKISEKSKDMLGIHSKRHIVHKIDGTVVGSWGMKVWGASKSKNQSANQRQNAHISRQELRRLLMKQVNPGNIQWSHKLQSYEEDDTCVHIKFHLGNGGIFETNADILVGADGIRSSVRKQKIGDDISPLRYLGCIVILGIVATPKSDLLDGETVFQTADGTTRLYAMPFAAAGFATAGNSEDYTDDPIRGETMWQLSFPLPEPVARELSLKGPDSLKSEAINRCNLWHEPIPRLIQNTPNHLITGYPVYDREILDKEMLRYGSNMIPDSRVTLIGDAAHPMSPFKGQGANQALLDALSLAKSIYRIFDRKYDGLFKEKLPEALDRYEDEMLKRSAVKVKASAEAANFLHTDIAIVEGNVTRGAAAEQQHDVN